MEGKAPSSIASDQAETDGSTQGGPPGHFNMQEKLHSLFSASSPGQPFNFNLPVSRQALSEAASLSSELPAMMGVIYRYLICGYCCRSCERCRA